MSQYWKLRTIRNTAHRAHVSRRLRELRAHMAAEVTAKTSEHDLRLATWNLMHFGDGGAYTRQTDAMLYISEIIDHFDLIALQEVNENIEQLEDLVDNYLGAEWDYIVTDTTGGDLGNHERMAFLFRKGKVRFAKLAGELVLPDGQTVGMSAGADLDELLEKHHQFARSPFIVGFECGWFSFKLCTVHIFFGNPKKPKDMSSEDFALIRDQYMSIRTTEIREVAKYLADRQKAERRKELQRLKDKGWDTEQSKANYILLGDFNIKSPEHETFQALVSQGFDIPEGVDARFTNLGAEKAYYDQIAHRIGDRRVRHRVAGVIDFRDAVFGPGDAEHYIDVVQDEVMLWKSRTEQRTREQQIDYFNKYRFKHQMSDHKLLWSAFQVDLADKYLESIEAEALEG